MDQKAAATNDTVVILDRQTPEGKYNWYTSEAIRHQKEMDYHEFEAMKHQEKSDYHANAARAAQLAATGAQLLMAHGNSQSRSEK